jgi:hypothetical protein
VKVLVIPEDPKHDQYLLKPLVEAAITHSGKPGALVRICNHRLIGGDATVLNFENLCEIVEDNQLYEVFVLVVERDCLAGRRAALDNLALRLHKQFPDKRFVAQCAHEEIEVWVLAGMKDLPKAWKWVDVRSHCDPKETYFDDYVKLRGIEDSPGYGRQILGREAAAQYRNRVRGKCPEIRVIESL